MRKMDYARILEHTAAARAFGSEAPLQHAEFTRAFAELTSSKFKKANGKAIASNVEDLKKHAVQVVKNQAYLDAQRSEFRKDGRLSSEHFLKISELQNRLYETRVIGEVPPAEHARVVVIRNTRAQELSESNRIAVSKHRLKAKTAALLEAPHGSLLSAMHELDVLERFEFAGAAALRRKLGDAADNMAKHAERSLAAIEKQIRVGQVSPDTLIGSLALATTSVERLAQVSEFEQPIVRRDVVTALQERHAAVSALFS